jgi:acetoin utilization deacetylase AcuC-like enzyme
MSAGTVVSAVEAVVDRRDVTHSLCLVRPPGIFPTLSPYPTHSLSPSFADVSPYMVGHHATVDKAMGFCFLNNVSIAARYAIDVLKLKV